MRSVAPVSPCLLVLSPPRIEKEEEVRGQRRTLSRCVQPQSDCLPDKSEPHTAPQRSSPVSSHRSTTSASLITFQQPVIFEPRMAQLETLEAKMASIEVSLSSTPRRKKNGSIGGLSLGGSIRSVAVPKEMAAKELESLRNALKDKENIIQSLKGQLNIPGLRLSHIRNNGNIMSCNNTNSNSTHTIGDLSETERKQAEDRLGRLRNDTDTKRLAIKNLKMALERLDITDNIDVRIQQAELEYQLGREELNLLTLLEETRALQHCLEESDKKLSYSHTLYSCLSGNEAVSLHAAEIVYDPRSPRFGASQKESTPGLWIDWALEDTGLCKGDRLVEVNGKIVLTKAREDLARLLQAAPDPALIVVLRKGTLGGCAVTSSTNSNREVATLRCELEAVKERAEESQRAKDGLRSDNIRLTHRISYLEEQVSELLNRKSLEADMRVLSQSPIITSTVKTSRNVTNINISSHDTVEAPGMQQQVFQKGALMTTVAPPLPTAPKHTDKEHLSANALSALPGRSKSSLSNISNTHIPAPTPNGEHKAHRHKSRNNIAPSSSGGLNGLMHSASAQNLDQVYKKHHHHHHHHATRDKDYNSETNSAFENYRARKSEPRLAEYSPRTEPAAAAGTTTTSNNIMDQSYRKATRIVHDLTKNSHSNGGHVYEKHRSKCDTRLNSSSELLKHYNGRKSTSVLDFRSEVHIGPKYESKSVENLDNDVVALNKTPNGKRLYKKLHDARSVKSLDFDSDASHLNYLASRATATHHKMTDYTSEPDNHQQHCRGKTRPTPPKKPLRLSLHRAQSLQSVETNDSQSPPITSSTHECIDSRKPMKRNYKGEPPPSAFSAIAEKHAPHTTTSGSATDAYHSKENVKWTSFAQKKDNYIYFNDHLRGNWC